MAYDSLKEAIYRLEKEAVSQGVPSSGDLESTGLLSHEQLPSNPECSSLRESPSARIFSSLLDKELHKISAFQASEQNRLVTELNATKADMTAVEESDWRAMELEHGKDDDSDDEAAADALAPFKKIARRFSGHHPPPGLPSHSSSSSLPKRQRALSASSEHDDQPEGSNSARGEDTVWWSNTDWAVDTRITFKLRLQALYRELSQLKQYIQLNMTGFRKITKKCGLVQLCVTKTD